MKDELTGNSRMLNKQSGILTMELLIAFGILFIVIPAVIYVVFGNQSIRIDTETNNEALYKAQLALESARAAAKSDFNLVNPKATTETSGDLTYTNALSVEQVDLWTKKVVSNISWPAEGGRTLNVQLETLVTNPDAVNGGDTCSSVLEGDWTHPEKREYEFGRDILHDTSSGFPITAIQSFDHKIYVTVNNDNGNNPGTFYILDISHPENDPVLLSPPLFDNASVGEGLNDVAVDGKGYAYVASAYTSAPSTCLNNNGTNKDCGQLQVIDVSNPALPSSPDPIKYTYEVPSFTSGNRLAAGTSIFYNDGIIYLGLVKAATGGEFITIDVGGGGTAGASPVTPKPLGSYEIDNGVNAIFVKGNYAYVASPNSQELKILDVSNPSSPILVGGFDAPGGGGNNGNGKSLNLVGNNLYFGRTQLTGDEFYILNNSDPESSLPILGSKNILNSGSNSSVNGIIIRDYLGFLITNSEFQTLRIDNPASITEYANPLTLPPGSGGGLQGTASDCEGNYIFVGSQSSNDKGYISVITGG